MVSDEAVALILSPYCIPPIFKVPLIDYKYIFFTMVHRTQILKYGMRAVRQADTSRNAEKNEETWMCMTDKQPATAA